jgi:hypothetical protein
MSQIEDLIERVRKLRYKPNKPGTDARLIVQLVNEVIRLRNDMPCRRCKGTGRMDIGPAYMGGETMYDTCDQCKKHVGKMYKPLKEIK